MKRFCGRTVAASARPSREGSVGMASVKPPTPRRKCRLETGLKFIVVPSLFPLLRPPPRQVIVGDVLGEQIDDAAAAGGQLGQPLDQTPVRDLGLPVPRELEQLAREAGRRLLPVADGGEELG